MSTGSRAVDDGCVHIAVLYHSKEEFLKFVSAFLWEGLRQGEPAWVAVPGEKIEPLRDALTVAGDVALSDVTWVDITQLGRNPGRILGAELSFLEQRQHRRVRMVAELMWPGRRDIEYTSCLQHEALCNLALAESRVTGLCPYDASRLADNVIDDVWVTHPLVEQSGSQRRSSHFSPDAALRRSNEPLVSSPAAVTFTVSRPGDLSRARQQSSRYGRLLGLSADRIADLQLVVTELATNSLQHGGGTSRLAFWEHDGYLVCEARDRGYLDDPLVGRRPPAKDRPSPSGLFVVNALTDLVRTHTTPEGTTIQAHLRLDRPIGEAA